MHQIVFLSFNSTVQSERSITHLGDLDISFVLLTIFSKFPLHLECYLQLLPPKRHIKISK